MHRNPGARALVDTLALATPVLVVAAPGHAAAGDSSPSPVALNALN
ncbi:MAG: hypothetical protein ABIO42_03935 [Burkholderiaceae bacterium]